MQYVKYVRWMVFAVLICGFCADLAADQDRAIKFDQPDFSRGKPLMQALRERRSQRSFDSRALARREMGDLLWAAFGVNRPADGKRTAPSAVNWQEIDIYVALPDGLYLYDAPEHSLQLVSNADMRPLAGRQSFVHTAPLVLIYVADYARITRGDDSAKEFYAAVDTGFVSQNVYLFCASENLATVVIGMVDKEALAKAMELRPEQKVILAQPVGYPVE